MAQSRRYPVHDGLRDACKFAATVSRFTFRGLDREFLPTASNDTATISFIEFNGTYYALTARHVINGFRESAKKDGKEYEGFLCLQSPGVGILGPFLTPPPRFLERTPDIAICPIVSEVCNRIGKEAFLVRAENDAKYPISHAIAIGFPTGEKFDLKDEIGRLRMAMPCVEAVAEGVGSDGSSDQVQFFSEIEDRPETGSLSGMSGGPVFWSTDAKYGLLGFVKEALEIMPDARLQTIGTNPRVNFVCQRVDYNILQMWTSYIDENWQAERDKVNAAIRSVKEA